MNSDSIRSKPKSWKLTRAWKKQSETRDVAAYERTGSLLTNNDRCQEKYINDFTTPWTTAI